MSAFIVGKDLIDLLVTASVELGPSREGIRYWYKGEVHCLVADEDIADEVGRILYDQNVASVNYRYNETTRSPGYSWRYVEDVGGGRGSYIPWSHVLRAIACYEYQSCEFGWEDSQARAICVALQRAVCDIIASDEDAPWQWTREGARVRWNELPDHDKY